MAPLVLAWVTTLYAAEDTPTDPPAEPAEKADSRLTGYAVPNLSFDTDDGLGFGARGELQRRSDTLAPYEAAWVLHGYASLRGYHHHRFRYDRLGLGRDGDLRLTTHVAFRQWTNDGYWGMGPGTAREPEFVGDFERDDLRRKRYRYTLVQPFAQLTLRATVVGPWELTGALNLRHSTVRLYEGSLLAQDAPYGLDGGLTAQISGGVLYDSRQPEIGATSGALFELSGRFAPPLPGGAGVFGGVYASARGFSSLSPRVTLAGRLMAERLWGELPFYELVHWGGFAPIAGFGGAEALRGVQFGRYHAPGKAVGNVELRITTLSHTVLDAPMDWMLVPFVDAGAVWGLPAGGPGWPVVPSVGLGVRAVFDETFVGRIDAALAYDPVLSEDNTATPKLNTGFYVVFDHTF